MRKLVWLAAFVVLSWGFSSGQNLVLFAGKASSQTNFAGGGLGGDIWNFLQFQFDFFKYINKDTNLYSDNPLDNRSDMIALSGNFILKLPIHLLPYLHDFDFVNPFLFTGYGYCLENMAAEYMDQPDLDNNSGFFSKVRKFDTWGYGLIVWAIPKVGIRLEYRSMNIAEKAAAGLPARKLSRWSFGICL